MLLFELGTLLRLEGRQQFGLEEDFRLGCFGRVNASCFGDLRLLLVAHRPFFDTIFGIAAAQAFHRKLVGALGSFIRHTASIVTLPEDQVYARVGEDGFTRLVRAFYAQVPNDDILGPMYPAHDLTAAEERLRDFLIGRFGGPPRYIEQRGHPRLRMRHQPFVIDQAARDRWVQLMDRAFDDTQLDPTAAEVLREFLHGMATFMMNSR